MSILPRQFNMVIPEELSVYWYNNNALITGFFAALSVLLPDGERFLIQTLRESQAQIKDSDLQQQISGFIGQEAHHSQAHRTFNQAYIMFQVDLPAMEVDFKHRVLEPLATLSLAERLAFGAAIEHFTAIFGEYVLKQSEALQNIPEVLRAFVLWHAIEELEHKSVVFDAFQYISQRDTAIRRRMFIQAARVLVSSVYKYQTQFLKQSGYQPSWPVHKSSLSYFVGRQGLFSSNIKKLLDYLKEDFHPSQHDHQNLIKNWQTRYPEIGSYLLND